MAQTDLIADVLREHFGARPAEEITVIERTFPARMRGDLQRGVDEALSDGVAVRRWFGVNKLHSYGGLDLSDLLLPAEHYPARVAAPRYHELDVGEAEPLRCLESGLWLLELRESRGALLLGTCGREAGCVTLRLQVAVPTGPQGDAAARDLLKRVETAVLASRTYRGKVLSLETVNPFAGASGGLSVHRLAPVRREDVVLPRRTLELLERNVLGFCEARVRLRGLGLPRKKGLLFYGPPGTGKTYTIRYLAGALPGHTTLLMTAEQVGLIGEYMALARLLQPSLVVIEDVDLIAQAREEQMHAYQATLLNELLNEMDGLRSDADVLFVLTTNRPQSLEKALASRPGRVDQAIEFPLPDEEGRRKLLRLYARGLALGPGVEEEVVRRTDGVSGAFLKEFARRCAQIVLERDGGSEATLVDADEALTEMLFSSGALNRTILGGPSDGAAAKEDGRAG